MTVPLIAGGNRSYGAPTYASNNNGYLPSRNVYNFRTNNTLKTRAALSRAANGAGVANFLWIGDSLMAGANGVGANNDPEQTVAAQFKAAMVASGIGIADGGTGVRPVTAFPGPTTGWVATGGFTNVGTSYAATATGGTLTFTSPRAGTVVQICYLNLSSAWSYTVDGGGVHNVNPTGTNTWAVEVLAGQTNAVHTIVITSGATGMFKSASVQQTTGLICHNPSNNGAKLVSGTTDKNWTNFAVVTGLYQSSIAALNGVTPDTVFVELGGNDLGAGIDPIATAQGFTTLRNQFPNSDYFILPSWKLFTVADSVYNPFMATVYAQADALNCPVIDWNDRVGGQAVAQANGMLGPDNVHGTYATYGGFGKAICDLFLD